MAETPLTDSIEALTVYANQVTGASDTNLSDAVYTLGRGYGGSVALLNRVVAGQDFDSNFLQADFPSNYSDYDFFVIINHGTTTTNDWFYYPFNTASTQGEYISTAPDNFKDIVNIIYKINNSYQLKRGALVGVDVVMGSNNYTGMRTYNASARIAPGSYIEIYGIKFN